MRLVEDSARVLSVRRTVVRHDALYLEAPAYLEYLVQDATHRLAYLLVGYGVYVVEDAHRLLELLHLDRDLVQRLVELDALRLNLVEALFGQENGAQVDGSARELLHVLLEILAGVGARPRPRGPRAIEYLTLLCGVVDVLKPAVIGYLELSELFY